jgi:pyruvate/2-oxoglutarate dehydrogenase complex dihydrolipoamide acyltransferase (E2) component
MISDYVMPKLAMAMNEGTINEWLVADGERVEKGAPIMVVETEKVSYDVESPLAGFLHIIVPVGETVPVETVVGKIVSTEQELQSLKSEESPATAAAPLTEAAAGAAALETAPAVASHAHDGDTRIKASPLARKLAADAGMDLRTVPGTGPGGRIVKRDIAAAKERAPAVAQAVTTPGEALRLPMKGTMRGTIARRMVESLQTAAQLSASWETDITDLLAVRQKFLAIEERLGTRVSINAFIAKAIALALRQVPIANASIEGEDIVLHASVNIGVAIALPGNNAIDTQLMVPVLHNVEQLGVVEIDKRMKAMIARARAGKLGADEMSGGTVTLSSTAGIAPPGMSSTPVLNLPNALLVGPSTPIERPVVYRGEIAVRTMLPISATFDHRILDGEPFSRFASALHELLETPELMLA